MNRAVASLALGAALAGCVGDRGPPRSAYVDEDPGYTVRGGDTLSAIAQRYGLQLSALARANAIAPPYLIRIGQRLRIPERPRYQPQAMISRPVVQPLPTFAPPPATIARPTQTPSTSPAVGPRIAGAPRLAWPADGPVASAFGSGVDPRGLAISVHAGAAIRAAASGTVLFAGTEPQAYGQLVLIDHGAGWVSAYGNLGRLTVKSGEAVRGGGRLGFAGERDLHFELRRDNAPVDPLPQLPPRF